MRIITEDNIDQLLPMSFSNNIGNLLHVKAESNEELKNALNEYTTKLKTSFTQNKKADIPLEVPEVPELPEPVILNPTEESSLEGISPQYPSDVSPAYAPSTSPDSLPNNKFMMGGREHPMSSSFISQNGMQQIPQFITQPITLPIQFVTQTHETNNVTPIQPSILDVKEDIPNEKKVDFENSEKDSSSTDNQSSNNSSNDSSNELSGSSSKRIITL
jgi:hypothetical protein